MAPTGTHTSEAAVDLFAENAAPVYVAVVVAASPEFGKTITEALFHGSLQGSASQGTEAVGLKMPGFEETLLKARPQAICIKRVSLKASFHLRKQTEECLVCNSHKSQAWSFSALPSSSCLLSSRHDRHSSNLLPSLVSLTSESPQTMLVEEAASGGCFCGAVQTE